jgi:NAD(P)-dependent dehydrogenase (short-subunit alcohol dehydrogenase family)
MKRAMAALAGKTALITGGGRGIGEAIARRLAADGAKVVVTGRTQAQIDTVASELGGVAIRADLADRASADELVAALADVGPIDLLINNAGIAESAPLSKVADEAWDRMMEVNATSVFRLCRALIPAMIEAGWGRVVNIASNAGVSGYRYTAAYCASKHAVVGLTRSLAIDLATTGVTINAVCPGWVDTDMVTEAVARISDKTGRSEDDARATLAKMTPQQRIIQPQEVAHLVASLCAAEAQGIHGQAIVIDGGAILK